METKLKVFESKQASALWREEVEEWYFSVVDIVAILSEFNDKSQRKEGLKECIIKGSVKSLTYLIVS